MTKTKRKRLHLERMLPLPGDVIHVKPGTNMCHRPTWNSGVKVKLWSDEMLGQRALLIGFDEFIEWALVMTAKGRLGWITRDSVGERYTWIPSS